jgi:Cu+-exporting ATPase
MTGESLPVLKQPQEAIYSGTKNLSQDVVIRATCRGQDNHLHQLLAEVTRAQNAPAQTSSLVDKISSRFIPLVISFAALTALGWYTLGPTPAIAAAITHAMSVLLCACPCALGLATPLSMALSLYRLLPLGILVKKASALEVAPKINKVVFDKTGTLTLPSIVQQSWLSGQDSHDTLQALVSLEFPLAKQHPLAQAIVNAYASTSPLPVTKPAYFDQGLEGTIGQQHWLVGSGLALQQRQIAIPEPLQHSVAAHWAQGMSSVYVVRERQCIGVLGVAQQLHPQAQATVNQLKQAGCTVAILSGDSNAAVTKVGAQLGISEIYAEHSASQKKACIERFKKTHTVAMIGDGLNDLSAAKMSDLSFAVNTWTSAAIEADVCLRGNLADIPHFLQVAKLVQTNIQQNLSWTFFYNSLALIGASGALYPWFGMSLNPILSSAAMMVSSLFVVGNAMRLPGLIERQWVKANSSTPAVPQSKVKVAPEFSNGFTYTPGYQQQATPRRASALPLADELIAAPSSPGL